VRMYYGNFTEFGRLVTAWFTEPPTIDVRTSYWKRTASLRR